MLRNIVAQKKAFKVETMCAKGERTFLQEFSKTLFKKEHLKKGNNVCKMLLQHSYMMFTGEVGLL